MFLAGLLDWHGNELPTDESIARSKCLEQGQAHIKTILETGGSILGYRPLELDGIQPWFFRGAECHINSYVQRGLTPTRPQRFSDDTLPVLSTWGFRVIQIIAETRFIKNERLT
jgi:hypothetical protein